MKLRDWRAYLEKGGMTDTHLLTGLLTRWAAGDRAALDELTPVVYDQLQKLAHGQLRGERAGHTLEPTALVHEAFLRLGNYDQISWQNRAHFFSIASMTMRRVLVDYARQRRAAKRGGSAVAVTLAESRTPGDSVDVDLIALDEALSQLGLQDPRQCRVVEMRYFGGLTHEEIAETLDVSVATVNRDWRVAKLWLRRALTDDQPAHD